MENKGKMDLDKGNRGGRSLPLLFVSPLSLATGFWPALGTMIASRRPTPLGSFEA
jgi:hypothetical protein